MGERSWVLNIGRGGMTVTGSKQLFLGLGRDLARSRPACLLDKPLPETSLLDRQNILKRIFNHDFLGVITKYFLRNIFAFYDTIGH